MANMPWDPKLKRLLLIDDDESLCEIFTVAMTKKGFVVATAADGLTGLRKMVNFQPHVILLDIMMPNLSGFDVLHRMQQAKIKIPVIVITGYGDRANEQIVRQEPNVLDYLTKPIHYGDLADFIRRYLDSK